MPRYEVAIVREMVFVAEVTAASEEEAEEIALQKEGWADNGDYQSGDLRENDAISIVEVEENA